MVLTKLHHNNIALKQFLPLLDFTSAGHIVYKDGKKLNSPGHPDNTPINGTTTVLKAQLDDKYIVIDADSCDLEKLAVIFPSIATTFTTRTTNTNKRHFWFLNDTSLKGIRKVGLDADGDYDILTKGIIYESHCIPGQVEPWAVINGVPPTPLTSQELEIIQTLTAYSELPSDKEHAFFVNKEVVTLAKKVVKAGTFKEGKKFTLTNAENNRLLKGMMNEEFRAKNQSTKARLDYPTLNYTNINTMAYKLSYNAAMDFQTRDSLLHIILEEQYQINPNSQKSQQLLDRQILGTLPQHESMLEDTDDLHISKLIKHTDIAGWGLVKFVDQKDIVFMEVNCDTLRPRSTGISDHPFISLATVLSDRLYSKEDVQLIPKVRIIDNPYEPRVSYDDLNSIDTINLANNTRYVEEAYSNPRFEDSPLKRLIYSYFEPEEAELYLHWLAHCTFGTRSPQTVLMLVAEKTDESGLGKSLLTQAIPQRLIEASATAKMEGIDKWGNMVLGKRLVVFNDMQKLKSNEWNTVTSFIRDRTTGGTKRIDDVKYGMPITSTSAVAFAMSANFIPPIEEHDRRMWIALPAQIYGTPPTEKCDQADAMWYRNNLERDFEEYIPELQALANHLLYLYTSHRNKYDTELYERAPETLGLEIAKRTGINFSEQLPKLISQGPRALTEMFNEEAVTSWAKFIVFQTHDNQCALSWRFFSDMFQVLHPENDIKSSPTKVAAAMQIDKSKFTTRSAHFNLYRDDAELVSKGLTSTEALEYSQYPMAALLVPMSEEIRQDYINFIKDRHEASVQ